MSNSPLESTPTAGEERVEHVAVIDFAVGDRGAVVVGLADDRARLNARAAEAARSRRCPSGRGRSGR